LTARSYAAWLRLSGISGRRRTEDVLVNIEVAERSGGKLLFRNAGGLFFAKNVRHFFNQAYITCLFARGTDKVNVLDRKDFDGGIVADIEEAMRFIARNTRTVWRIDGLQRQDVPEYPMQALREAITNAVMHRDWFMDGANVFVELYTDRIEVSSPGGLPKGMTLTDLGRKSIQRNALIADLLHRIGFIEKAGTGIRRIRAEARAGGYPEPQFEETGFVTATFWPNPAVRMEAEAKQEGRADQVGTKSGPSRDQVGTKSKCWNNSLKRRPLQSCWSRQAEPIGRSSGTRCSALYSSRSLSR
jgi:ATP-dependent DNA helicase RecG